jgi:hypothetical protein
MLRTRAIVGAVVCLAAVLMSTPAPGQTNEQRAALQDLVNNQPRMLTREYWARRSIQVPDKGLMSQNCGDVFALATAERSAYPAEERYQAGLAFKSCVAAERAERMSKVAPESLGTVDAVYVPILQHADIYTKQAASDNQFMGQSFGVGVGVSFGKSRVVSAEVGGDGNIRATKTVKQQPRAILEAHHYVRSWCLNQGDCNAGKRGLGPFFALAATDDTISAVGFGITHGWRTGTGTETSGITMSVGVVLDADVEELAPGFEVGKPLPAGETVPKIVKRSRWSPLLMFTKTF